MKLLELRNVSRIYKTEISEKKALNNVSISFPSSGLIAISGKSGSGKSTMLNLIALLDKASSGTVLFNGQDISLFKDKRINKYRNKEIGIIFQSYHLLEEQSVIFNVALPMMIEGHSKKEAYKDAVFLLEGINFPKEQYNQKCQDLSGGEKERIAILRSLINNPKVLLADEPTGSLDSKNSILVMDLLKKASKKKLVILVSHNNKLVEEYADRIIRIKDGQVVDDIVNNVSDNGIPFVKDRTRTKNKEWVNKIAIFNIRKRIKRNILSSLSLIIGLIASMLIIGFSNGSPSSIENESYKQLDYGVATISKEIKNKIENTGMSITQMLKPSPNEITSLNKQLKDYYVMDNYDALVPYAINVTYKDKQLEKIFYQPIFSFKDNSFDKSLLIKGYIPNNDTLNEVLINKKALEYLTERQIKPFSSTFKVTNDYTYHHKKEDNNQSVVTDYFVYDKEIKITGVVDELDFMSSPKIYYSYIALDNYLSSTLLNNLSTYMNADISWSSIVSESESNSEVSSYSLRLFLKDYRNKRIVKETYDKFEEPFKVTSNPLLVSNALSELVSATTMGMELFLIISLIGTSLILGIVSFASYSEDKKVSAILSCLGADKDSITEIYVIESIILGIASIATSFFLSPVLSILINKILNSTIGFSNMIDIPFKSFLNVPFLLPLIIIVLTLLVCIVSTNVPIWFSKKISLKEELAEE